MSPVSSKILSVSSSVDREPVPVLEPTTPPSLTLSSSLSASSDQDLDCLERLSSDDDAKPDSPSRPSCDLFKNGPTEQARCDTPTASSSGSKDTAPSSRLLSPAAKKKIAVCVAEMRVEEVEKKLKEMQSALDAKKPFEITFAELGEVDRKINSIQKRLKEKGEKLAESHKGIFKCVADALDDLIQVKLKVIQDAVDAGKAATISIQSTEELATDISKLRYLAERPITGRGYFETLEKLAELVTKAHLNEAEKLIVKPPLLGEEIALEERAKTYSEGPVKNGMIKLSNLFVMRSVRGDGHCLFRATLAHILQTWLCLNFAQRKAKIDQLDKVVGTFDKASLNEKYAFFKETFQNAVETDLGYVDIVRDEKTSDELVAFLRELVCEHNRKNGNEVFGSFLLVLEKTKEKYLEEMMSMETVRYAEHPEVQALSTVLGLNICVIDVELYGKPKDTAGAFRHLRAHENGPMELYLLLRPGHYDLARLKNQLPPVRPKRASRGTKGLIEYAIDKEFLVTKA